MVRSSFSMSSRSLMAPAISARKARIFQIFPTVEKSDRVGS